MGPLTGTTIIEMAGLGPAPFCGMLLADMGARVICINRASAAENSPAPVEISERGKQSIAVNLKSEAGREVVLKLCEEADALIEGFRPGVMERLGLSPEVCMARNKKLVFGRMTGWGQTGPLANAAGHDINYISLSGALHAMGRAGEKPQAPLNLVGDFGGGAMFLAMGLMAAMLEASKSGEGQVVDVSMVEGSASLMSMMYSFMGQGLWQDKRGVNLLDTGAHFYDSYETKDGKHISIGSIEPQFYALLVELAELDKELFAPQMDPRQWPKLSEALTEIFKCKTRDQWCEILEGTDVCFAPIMSMKEAPHHSHNKARQSFIEIEGVTQPGPAPKFSRTASEVVSPPPRHGQHTDQVLADLGYDDVAVKSLRDEGALT